LSEGPPLGVSQKAVMADALEPVGQNVEEKAADEPGKCFTAHSAEAFAEEFDGVRRIPELADNIQKRAPLLRDRPLMRTL
jgi:hypothetical protein